MIMMTISHNNVSAEQLTRVTDTTAAYSEAPPSPMDTWPGCHPAARSASPDTAAARAARGGPATATACRQQKHAPSIRAERMQKR